MRHVTRETSDHFKSCEGLADTEPNATSRVLTICNQRGLHARASARFVQVVDQFDADVTVQRDGMSVGGQSIMGLMMLAATKGSDIHVTATGEQADAVLSALAELVADRFGEDC